MSVYIDVSGLDKKTQLIKGIANLDATPLMFTWMKIIDQDNREGILAGLDKDGIPLAPVSYRPKHPPGMRVTKGEKKESKWNRETRRQFRLNQRPNLKKGHFFGIGPFMSGINNNLSTAEYQLLGGPPLAPRDQFSRVITNLEVTFGGPSHGSPQWFAEGRWAEVVDIKGRPFLHYHFDGIGQKKRDLRGVRPGGIAKAVSALKNWARDTIRKHFE